MQFLDMVLEAFGDKVANLKKISPSSPLSEYWERGYQVVVVYKNSDITKMEQYNGLAWNSGYIRSPWPEANTTDMLRTRLVESSTSKRHPKAFFVLQGILTPDGELIKNQIMDTKGISIKSFAGGCNCHFSDWITGDPDCELKLMTCKGDDENGEEGRKNSIVIADYIENGSVIPAVINSNRNI